MLTRESTEAGRTAPPLAVKVPAVAAMFWVIKALTTAFGESTSDFLVHALVPEVAVVLGFVLFCAALAFQLRQRTYRAVPYWLAVASVGVFGTMAADVLHVGLHIPYLASAAVFAVGLGTLFVVWYRVEGTLSVHSITTRRRELFYWTAVVATFALGTAAGDMTATTLHLGYFSSIWLFAAAIAVPAIGYWRFNLNPVLAFWTAYVLTRPVGASVADWLGVSHARGGLDLGPGPVSLVLGAAILGCVAFVARHDRGSA